MTKIAYISLIALNLGLFIYYPSFWWNAAAAGFVLGIMTAEIIDDMA